MPKCSWPNLAAHQSCRVGLIHWTFPPTTGGVESHIFDLARLLPEQGCTVTIITGEPRPMRHDDFDVIVAEFFNLEALRAEGRSGFDIDIVRTTLKKIITELDLNVVHGHNLHHFSPAPALALEDLRDVLGFKLHHTFHETWPDVLQDTPVYRDWNGNYAVSRFIQKECVERLGFEPTLFPLAIDTLRFSSSRPCFSGSEPPRVLHPARLLPWKGVHVSVQMLAQLHRRGMEARLILTDTQRIADWHDELHRYRAEILALVHSLGMSDWVEFIPVDYADMPRLYETADVVVYPTTGEEPFGLVPVEAMSTERPIVASRSGGIAETIIDGETGYLVEPGDTAGLVERVYELLRDPSQARRLAKAGRDHVIRCFNMERYTQALTSRYLADTPLDNANPL